MGNVIKAVDIAKFLNSNLIGNNIEIKKVASINNITSNCLVFVNKVSNDIKDNSNILYLLPLNAQVEKLKKCSYILVENPRLSFAKVVEAFFERKIIPYIDQTAKISSTAKIGKDVYIGKYTIIGDSVTIGDGTIIRDNVIIHYNVTIGTNCYIKSGVVIGEDGFGFEFDEDGVPIKISHLGGVEVKNNVEIGANTVIARGTLDNTIIEENVKIDALVHIAHNCIIGQNSVIIALAQISGSVKIGKNSWISPSATIIQKKTIGENVKIGIGSVILDNIESNKTIMGLNAIDAIDIFKFKKKNNFNIRKEKK